MVTGSFILQRLFCIYRRSFSYQKLPGTLFIAQRHLFVSCVEMAPKRKSAAAEESKKAEQVVESAEADTTEPPPKKSKQEKNASNQKKRKATTATAVPDMSAVDFTSESETKDGKKWNIKFSSWNVNGIRAWLDKNAHAYINAENPDIFCVQETKCDKASIPAEANVPGYHVFWLSGDKDGYSGTGLFSKVKPIDVTYGLGIDKHDKEGRVITAEYESFYFVTAYVPNSGRGLPRLPYRTKEWDPDFKKYLINLDKKKPVIMCGDLNVANLDIDLANPKSNKKTPGFTPEEREQFGKLLEEGDFVDSFRHLYPDKTGAYSFWTYMGNARAKNVGWRLDYFLMSKRLVDTNLCDSLIRPQIMGSDHCPIVCLMHFD